MKNFLLILALGTAAVSQAISPFDGESGGRVLYDAKARSMAGNIEAAGTALLQAPARAATNQGPALQNTSGAHLQGFLAYDGAEKMPAGWYEFNTQGDFKLIWEWPEAYCQNYLYPRGGWMRNGKLCLLAAASLNGDQQLYASIYAEMDPLTGQASKAEVVDVYENPFTNFISSVYVPAEDRVYGFTIAPDGSMYSFASAPADDIMAASEVARLSSPGYRCYCIAYSPDEDCFYGVSFFDKLVRISKDGIVEDICEMPLENLAGYRGGLIYSPLDGCLIYNPQYYSKNSELYAIYPAEKRIERLHSYDADKQIVFFHTDDLRTTTGDPAKAATVKEIAFTSGEHTATVTYTLPTTTRSGAALPATALNWTACTDNVTVKSGSGLPGTDVEVTFENLADGRRALQLFVDSEGAYPGVAGIFAGSDAPLAPQGVELSVNQVKWRPVRKGEFDQYLNRSDLSYTVYVNDVKVGSTTTTSMAINLDADAPMTAYTAKVVATASGVDSKPGISNKLVYGKALTLPYHAAPTAEDFELMSVFNLDGGPDYGVWTLTDRWGDYLLASGWSYSGNANDWVILPGVEVTDATKALNATLQAACGSESSTYEYISIWAGPEPDPAKMSVCILPETRVMSVEWTELGNLFAVPEVGTWYVGIKSSAKENQYSLLVRDINISATDIVAKAPSAPVNPTVSGVDHAALTATVSFTFAGTYLTGQPLDASADIVVTILSPAGTKEVHGTPGEETMVTVPTIQGMNAIVLTSSLDGIEGAQSRTEAFTGVDRASFVEKLQGTVSEDNFGIYLTWEAPLEGLDGRYFSSTGLDYYVGVIDSYGEFLEEPRLAGRDVYEYEYRIGTNSQLASAKIAVVASNAAGISPARSYVSGVMGKPYNLPMHETFEAMTLNYSPLVISQPSSVYANGSWDWAQPELVNEDFYNGPDDFALVGYSTEGNARVRLGLPKFSTSGYKECLVTVNVWNGHNGANPIRIYASTYGVNPTLIDSFAASEGWEELDAVLPEKFLNRPWVSIHVDGTLPTENHYLVLTGYRISGVSGLGDETLAGDSALSVSASNGTVTVCGAQGLPLSIYSVDGRTVGSTPCAGSCETFAPGHGVYIVCARGLTPVKVVL